MIQETIELGTWVFAIILIMVAFAIIVCAFDWLSDYYEKRKCKRLREAHEIYERCVAKIKSDDENQIFINP